MSPALLGGARRVAWWRTRRGDGGRAAPPDRDRAHDGDDGDERGGPASSVLAVRGLRIRFGSVPALDGVDLDVARGEVVGVLGRPGAGTSTLLAAVAGLLVPTSGEVRVLGHDPARRPQVAHRLVAALPSVAAAFARLTVRENLRLWSDVHAAPLPVDDVLDLAGLDAVAGRRAERLDPDRAQALLLALTFVGGTPLVVLDEPAGGRGPLARAALDALVRHRAAAGGSVLLTSRDAGRAAGLCDRVALLRRGRLLDVASPQRLVERYAPDGGAAVLVADPAEASALSSAAPGATFERRPEGTLVEVPGCDAARLAGLLAGLSSVREVRHHEGTLADAVRRATADRRPQHRGSGSP
ncbi:ATP-binding cassette domain-containing protein [Kineococcus sp. R8]|uniref:ATP-binding cassette domain-containing protein n=1 Tax=Kineococcus siccus TaxID=2696567 RepID=UPI0014130727|nr:ABC transporter ATP-binding protein [Kineococcus siccus]NAZ84361.1 ATP-binding cassette domain-containing protein [Kineococcus siccus]